MVKFTFVLHNAVLKVDKKKCKIQLDTGHLVLVATILKRMINGQNITLRNRKTILSQVQFIYY